MIDVLNLIAEGAITGMILSVIAVGFSVIYRSGRIFNLAQGEMVAFGAFTVAALVGVMPAWIAILIAMATMSLLGVLSVQFALRPLIGESTFTLFLATIGLIMVFRGIAILLFGGNPAVQVMPKLLQYLPDIGNRIVFDSSRMWAGILSVAVILALAAFFRYTRSGMRMTAVAEDHLIARTLGISVSRSIAISWALAGAITAIAALFYLGGRPLNFEIGNVAFIALPIVLLAGVESIEGLLPAGFVVGVAQQASARWLDPLMQGGASLMLPFVLLLLILLVKPTGFFGWQRIERI